MGQEWLKIDMHMHSHFSAIMKPSDAKKTKNMSAKEFVEILLQENVKIFSITDHNYFSKSFYDEIDAYTHNLDIKIINGVEFDAKVDLNNGEENYIHICIYFDDNVDRGELEKTVHNLYFDASGLEIKPRFIDILNELKKLNTKYIVVPHGDKDRGLFKKRLIDKLNIESNPEFYKYAMYKIFNAFDVKANFYEESISWWATSFFEKTQKFDDYFSGKTEEETNRIKENISHKIKDNSFVLTDDEQGIYDYIMAYGSYFAYFTFSDWHNAETYSPTLNNFIFGSTDTAFNSFEMATLDPVSRVICTSDKEITIPNTLLHKISFKIYGKEKNVLFSPGLNAIVGKRGSGKSLLIAAIKNLVKADDPNGAILAYKGLHVSNIKGENRGGIPISLGSLNSVAFLSQNDIKAIFETPEKAQEKIFKNFINIKKIDKSKIQEIVDIGEKIKQYNINYKNLTSNILALKKSTSYIYKKIEDIDYNNINEEFDETLKSVGSLINLIKEVGLDTTSLDSIHKMLNEQKTLYGFILLKYSELVNDINNEINEINAKRSNNQITQNQNKNDIRTSLSQITSNFESKLYYEKMKYLIKHFKMENPKVELNKKGKYLFVTYYEIPEDLQKIIEEKVCESISYSSGLNDIEKYMSNNGKKNLKSKMTSVVTVLKNYLNDDVFIPKKEFYEIKNNGIDYKKEVRGLNDLKKHVKDSNLYNLSEASLGTQSVAYLDMLFDLDETILILDQPEDNIDNDYISNYLVPNIKNKKKIKQLIFVTHNPSVAVYGDAFNYIFVENDGTIEYKNYLIEKNEDKEKLIKILEGGKKSFANRNHKFGDIIGEEEYDVKNN